MRAILNFALLRLCLCVALLGTATGAWARDNAPQPLLSPAQGQALADFALLSGPRMDPKPDCSHLVHMLYSQAGLNYSYKDSRVMLRGLPEFVRVKAPQPGDLIVWMGHAGIVLSAEDTTFLSSARSGIIAESWTSDYWTARGRPRFFRYIVGAKADLTLLADTVPQQDRHAASRLAQPQPQTETLRTERPNSPALSSYGNTFAPSSVIVMRQRSKANKIDVAAALRQNQLDLAARLLDGERLDSARPLSVVEHLEVTRIEIKHGSGTIRVKFNETLALELGAMIPAHTVERELRIDLRDGVWVISDPEQRVYIPREQTIDIFELQVELFAQGSAVHTDKRAIIKALALLYDQEPASVSAQARSR